MTEPNADTLMRLLAEADWLNRLGRALAGSDDLAADISQQTWLTALQSPPRHGRSPRGWLATVARRVAGRMARTDRRRVVRERMVAREVDSPDPARLMARVEMQRLVADAVLELDEPYRSVVVMRYFEDRTPSDIAAALAVPPATIRTRLHRAHQILRGRLDDEHGGDRCAWVAVLLPFAGQKTGAATAAGTAATGLALTGGLLMGTKTLLATAVVIAVAATLAITGTFSSDPASPPPGPPVGTGPAELGPLPSGAEPVVAEEPDAIPPAPERAKGEACAIRGRILGPEGAPVKRAGYHLILGNEKVVSQGRPGEDGRFLMVVPADPGEADLVVDAPGYLPLIRPIESLLETAGVEHELTLDPGLTITGSVQDETGRPLKTALFAIRLDEPKGTQYGLTRHKPFRKRTLGFSDQNGRFEVKGLAEGRYRLEKADTNYRVGEGSTVTCEAGAKGITVVLYRGVALTLRMHHAGSDLPVKDKVSWILTLPGGGTRGGGSSSGSPVVRGLPGGTLRLVVTAPNYEPVELTFDLSLDTGTHTLDVPLTRTGDHGFATLAGTVVMPEGRGKPAPGFRVLVSEFGGIFGFEGKETGAFEIRGAPAGTYHLRAVSKDRTLVSECEAVRVSAGERCDVKLRLLPAGRVILSLDGTEACEEERVEFRLYDGSGVLVARLKSLRGHFPKGNVTLGALLPGAARVLAVARGRILGQAEVTVAAGSESIAVISLLGTADGAPLAPEAPALWPRPRTMPGLPPPAAPPPTREENASAKVARLTEQLGDADQKKRFEAVVELGKLGDEAPIRSLTHVIENDPDLFVRRAAIVALGRLGRRALAAVPAIARLLPGKEPFVSDAAARAIAEITGKAFPYQLGMTAAEIDAAAEKLVAEVE